jgi:alkylresorcinol/alkylpyrone synthase
VAVAPVVPSYTYAQDVITDALVDLISPDRGRQAVMRRLHGASGVRTRHLVIPLEDYGTISSFQESNDLFISAGADLTAAALAQALAIAGLHPEDVDFLLFTSVTGIAAPSIDAQLIARLGLRSDVKRMPSFGLGCVAGAAGLARVHDYLVGHPGEVAALVSLELCSLTIQRGDDSMANIVASGLFGDGAAAAIVVGSERAEILGLPGPDIVDTRSRVYPDTEGVLGWDIGGTGFRIVLTSSVPTVIDTNFAGDARGLLEAHGLGSAEVGAWVAHPGGPKVLESFARALDLEHGELALSWESLARVGNLSSSSVLHILADTMATEPAEGTVGMLFALGPGVSAELVLLRWAGVAAARVADTFRAGSEGFAPGGAA